MYTVAFYDDGLMDDVKVFVGTLEQCKALIEEEGQDEYDEDYFILAPDGFTVVE